MVLGSCLGSVTCHFCVCKQESHLVTSTLIPNLSTSGPWNMPVDFLRPPSLTLAELEQALSILLLAECICSCWGFIGMGTLLELLWPAGSWPQKVSYPILTWFCTRVLCASVKCCGPVSRVLTFAGQRTGSWGSRLTCEPRPVHRVGFIREKGKVITRAMQRTSETGGSLLRWRLGLFMDTLTLG
jgi:hypothetical protein